MMFIGQRLQRVPHWLYPDREHKGGVYRKHPEMRPVPQMARVAYINPEHRTCTVRYDKTGFLETFKIMEDI